MRDNYLDKTGYVVREIASDRFCVVASNQHRFAGRSSMALAELANENFIMFDKGTVVHELAVDACRSAGFEPRIFYASLRIESILGLVASNVGVALMMERVVDYHRHPEVVVIALEESIASSIVLVAPKAGKQAWPARVFVEFMDKALAHRCDEGSIPRNKLLSDDL